jgi:hypothetical protein
MRMTSLDDVRRIALSLPETLEEEGNIRFAVRNPAKKKFSFHTQSFAWAMYERVHPKKPKVLVPDAVSLRVEDIDEKELLLASDAGKFFSTPHYDGYAVLHARLSALDDEELTQLITDAWRCLAPPALVSEFGGRNEKGGEDGEASD